MPFSVDDDFNAEEELEDLVFDIEEDEEDEQFDWYYELDSDREDSAWKEMSYSRYKNTNRWSSLTIEPTEYELYLSER